MPTYEFSLPSGETFEIDSDAELNEQQLSYVASNHKQFLNASKPKKTSLFEDVKSGFAGGANTLDTIASLGLYGGVKALTNPAELPGIQDALNERIKARNAWANPENREQGIVGSVVSGVAQLPTAVMGGVDTAKRAQEAGESAGRSAVMGTIDQVGNALGLVLPGVGKTLTTKVVGGAGSNIAQDVAARLINSNIATTKQMQEELKPTWETTAVAGVTGGVFGAADRGRQTKQKPGRKDPVANLDDVAPIQEPTTAPLPTHGEAAAPIDMEYLKQRRAQEAALAYDVPKPPGFDEAQARQAQINESNAAFLQEQAQRRAQLAEQQASKQGPESPTTSELEAAIINRRFLEEQQAARAQREQAAMEEQARQRSMDEAQNAIQRRQAQMESEVAREATLGRNAAERSRQENAPTGFSEWLATKQAEIAALEAHNNKLKEQQRVLEEQQASTQRIEEARQAQEAAQRTINERQAALEAEVRKQRSLDFNAAERARQAGADTGYGKWVEGLREDANKRRPGDNTPLQFTRESTLRADLPDNYRYEGAIPGHELMTDIYGAKAVERQVGIKSAWDKHAIDKLLEDTALRTKEEKAMAREDAGWKLQDEMKDRPVSSRDVGEKTRMMKGGRGPTTTPRLHVRKSQRGGIDFDAIVKGLTKLVKRDNTGLSGIPGHKDTASMLTTYASPKDIMQKLSTYTKDVKLINQSLRSGMSHTYVFNDHPLFKAVGELFQTAAKRTDMQVQKFVSPVQDALISLRRASDVEYVQLSKVFLKEMFERRSFTPEQLQQAGFTPRQIETYQQTRAMFKAAAARMNEVLKSKGLPELNEADHYLASRRTGDYAQYFYDKQGRLVWMTKDTSTRGARKTKEWLHKNVPELDSSKTHLEVKKTSGGIEDPAASFAAMLQRFGDDPIVGKLKEAMLTKDAASGIRAFQQQQHLKHKANIRGFEGDKPWLSDKENAQDLFSQQIHYARNAFAWSELNSANDVASQVLRDENMVKKFPEAVKHAQMYADRNMGREGQLFKNFDSWIGHRLGLSGSSIRKGAGITKDLWVSQKMITNTGNIIQNTLQPVNTIPYHMMLSDKGYSHNPAKTFLLASADTLGGMAQHYGNKIGVEKTAKAMTELGREATKYAEDNFILDLSPFDEHQSIEKTYVPGVTEAATVAREFNQITNKSANFAAFMSFVHHLDQSGKFKTRADLFKEAEHWMNASMVDPRPGERPFLIQDTGSVGSLSYGLQSYVLNKYNSLAGFIDHGVKGGSWTPFATALTADIALAGVKGFIPLATYMAIADYINSNSSEDILPDPRQALMEIGDSVGESVKEVAGEKAGQFASDAVATGMPGAAVGLIPGSKAMDLGPRFSSLPSVPGVGMLTDIGRQVGDVATGLTNAAKGDDRGLWQAANAVAPVGVLKGSTEALGPFSDDRFMDTNVRTLETTGYKRDDTDKLFKAIGIPSLAENRAKDQNYQFNRLNKIDRERVLKLTDRIANNAVTGRPINDGDIARLVKDYPDIAESMIKREIEKKAVQWNVDAETRNAMNLNALSKIERYKQVYGIKR